MKRNICIRNKCIKCCIETSMPLSNEDIESIQRIGYDKNHFVRLKEGWLKLKNENGRCVFHNGKICLIYENRPEGCRSYPLIFNEECKSAVVDEECPHKDSFKFTQEDIDKLQELINRLKSQRNDRKIF